MASMGMHLYAAAYESVALIQCSPPSWMAHILLMEHGLDHEIHWLSFADGEHRTTEMLARNARGTVPVLEHDGVCVSETFAILQYIDHHAGGSAWMPREQRARARHLTRFHESASLKDAGMSLLAYLMQSADSIDAKRIAELRDGLARELAHWEAIPSGDGFGGETPSLADLVVFCYLATLARLGFALDVGSKLEWFCSRFRNRASVQRTWPTPWAGAPEHLPLSDT